MNEAKKAKAVGAVAAVLLLAIARFYLWTAAPAWKPGFSASAPDEYYNLLTRGFLRGHLYLDMRADPYLATLADPWDPAQRGEHGLHDASYYRGRYYLYFGVAPALFLFLPFRLLTGHFLEESTASVLFACVGLALAIQLLLAVRRRYFPRASVLLTAACVLTLGAGDMMAVMLRRPGVWEVPISCGYACCMGALAALFQSFHGRRRGLWLALSAAAFGLAVASRPTYLFGCPALLVPLWVDARERGLGWRFWRDRRWLVLALAVAAPLVAIGSGLALYNYLRFGDPLNFGFRNVMAGAEDTSRERIFAWPFLLFNLRVYLFAPARWSEYFPYVVVARLPPSPPGHLGVEDPFGLMPNLPFCLLTLAALGRALLGRDGRLRWFAASAGAAAAGVGLAVSAFGGADNRYMVDFAPMVMLLACLGGLGLAAGATRVSAARLASACVCLLALQAAAFNYFASLRHNELFRVSHPALYRDMALRWNRLSVAWDRLRGAAYGPIELTVTFPRDRTGTIEPLVVTGEAFLSDYLFVHYLGPDSVRFGLEHTSRGSLVGAPVRLDFSRPHKVTIDLGSLYPPAEHPYWNGTEVAEVERQLHTVRVWVDGRVALDGDMDLYDPVGAAPEIGSSGDRPGLNRPFSGRIISSRRVSVSSRPVLSGPLRVTLVLPPFTTAHNEPLVCSGTTGHGDLLYVRYEAPGRLSFGYDHWGAGGPVSAPVSVNPSATQVLEVDFGALHPGEPGVSHMGRIQVRLNGDVVLDQPAYYWSCDPHTIAVGVNPIGASTANPSFTGTVLMVTCDWL